MPSHAVPITKTSRAASTISIVTVSDVDLEYPSNLRQQADYKTKVAAGTTKNLSNDVWLERKGGQFPTGGSQSILEGGPRLVPSCTTLMR